MRTRASTRRRSRPKTSCSSAPGARPPALACSKPRSHGTAISPNYPESRSGIRDFLELNMTEPTRNGRGFATGLFGGAALGTIAGLFFAPQAYAAFTKLRNHMSDSVADAGHVAT